MKLLKIRAVIADGCWADLYWAVPK